MENKLHNLAQYLLTLKPNTPHYRDTKKHYTRLRTKFLKSLEKQK